MSAMTQALVSARGRRSRVWSELAAAWDRGRARAVRAWLALRRMDTGTVMLIVGLLFALVFVYALTVTTLTRRH
jgi:hypothetical protein